MPLLYMSKSSSASFHWNRSLPTNAHSTGSRPLVVALSCASANPDGSKLPGVPLSVLDFNARASLMTPGVLVSMNSVIAVRFSSSRWFTPPTPSTQSSWNHDSSNSGGSSACVSSPILRTRGRMVSASLRVSPLLPCLSRASIKPRRPVSSWSSIVIS